MEGNFEIFNVVNEMMGHMRKNLMQVTKLTSSPSQQSENLRDGSNAVTDMSTKEGQQSEKERAAIIDVYIRLTNHALSRKYSFNRWKNVVNIMIKK
eukprot:2370518-Ditylum_brightwellii.AAC.1